MAASAMKATEIPVDGQRETLQAWKRRVGRTRIQAVEFATHQVELWRQAQRGKVKGIDEEEAKRQFFQSAIRKEDSDVAALQSRAQPRYTRSLLNMTCVMDDMFHAVVDSINGAHCQIYVYRACEAYWAKP